MVVVSIMVLIVEVFFLKDVIILLDVSGAAAYTIFILNIEFLPYNGDNFMD